jgi:hypothetical protein
MVRVKNDRDTVKGGDFVYVLGSRNTSSDGGLVVSIISGLSGNEETSSLGESNDDRSTVLLGGLHTRVDGTVSYNIYTGDGKSSLLGVIKKINKGLSCDNTWLDRSRQLSECLSSSFLKKIKRSENDRERKDIP